MAVAKAYVDQLERADALSTSQITELRQAIQKAEGSKNEVAKLKTLVPMLEKSIAVSKNQANSARLQALADTFAKAGL